MMLIIAGLLCCEKTRYAGMGFFRKSVFILQDSESNEKKCVLMSEGKLVGSNREFSK